MLYYGIMKKPHLQFLFEKVIEGKSHSFIENYGTEYHYDYIYYVTPKWYKPWYTEEIRTRVFTEWPFYVCREPGTRKLHAEATLLLENTTSYIH